MKKLLTVFAHPDDESFWVGGTIAKYTKAGWHVRNLCLTKGEAGKPENLAEIRQKELTKAAKILGITETKVLDYPDSKLSELTPGELEEAIRLVMLEVCPDIVITHDPTGGLHHPDHIKTCYAATYAFQRYAQELAETQEFVEKVSAKDASVKKRHFLIQHKIALRKQTFTEAVDDQKEPKLYYVCVPNSLVRYAQELKIIPKENYGKPILGTPDKKITNVIDIRRMKKLKAEAILAHESQINSLMAKVSGKVLSNLLSREYFVMRYHGVNEIYLANDDRVEDRL